MNSYIHLIFHSNFIQCPVYIYTLLFCSDPPLIQTDVCGITSWIKQHGIRAEFCSDPDLDLEVAKSFVYVLR